MPTRVGYSSERLLRSVNRDLSSQKGHRRYFCSMKQDKPYHEEVIEE